MEIRDFTGEHAFLSNFHREADGLTAEHRFQAAKTLDAREKEAVLNAKTPTLAKRAGRKVSLRRDWEDFKDEAMRQALRTKFQDPTLRQALLDTGHATLIEGNRWHDQTWGDCSCGRLARCSRPGQNRLGVALMAIRAEIRASED